MELPPDDMDEIKGKRICVQCIQEPYLKEEVTHKGIRRKCAYCHQTARTFSIGELAARMEEAFDRFYTRTSEEMSDWDYYKNKEFGELWEREGQPVTEAIEEA